MSVPGQTEGTKRQNHGDHRCPHCNGNHQSQSASDTGQDVLERTRGGPVLVHSDRNHHDGCQSFGVETARGKVKRY